MLSRLHLAQSVREPSQRSVPPASSGHVENFLASFALPRWIWNLEQRWFALPGRRRFEDAVSRKDYAARNIPVQLSNVAGPRITNERSHGFLTDGLAGFVHGDRTVGR